MVAHVAVTLDGATTGFTPHVGRFYELAGTWREDVTLAGADTILAQEPALRAAPRAGPRPDGPLLAVVDGRGRVREWAALREAGHWSDVVALRAGGTPPRPPPDVAEIVVGPERVDLTAALAALGERRGAEVVRVDSGGTLIGALLDAHLLDEVSLLVHPCTAEGPQRRWHGKARVRDGTLRLTGCDALDDGLVWLRYEVSDGR